MTIKRKNGFIAFIVSVLISACGGGGNPSGSDNNSNGSSSSGASLTVSASLVSSGNLADSGIYNHMHYVLEDNISVSADGKTIYIPGSTASDSDSLLAEVDISVVGAPKIKKVIHFNGDLSRMVTSRNGKLAYATHANTGRAGSWGIKALDLEKFSIMSNYSSSNPRSYFFITLSNDEKMLAATHSGFVMELLDVSNIKDDFQINYLGQYIADANIKGIALSKDGNIAYLAINGDSLERKDSKVDIVDISDKKHPKKITSITLVEKDGFILPVLLSHDGKYIFTGTVHGLYTVDISNPKQPKIVARVGNLNFSKASISKDGKRLFLSDSSYGSHILDVSKPKYPVLLRSYRDNLGGGISEGPIALSKEDIPEAYLIRDKEILHTDLKDKSKAAQIEQDFDITNLNYIIPDMHKQHIGLSIRKNSDAVDWKEQTTAHDRNLYNDSNEYVGLYRDDSIPINNVLKRDIKLKSSLNKIGTVSFDLKATDANKTYKASTKLNVHKADF